MKVTGRFRSLLSWMTPLVICVLFFLFPEEGSAQGQVEYLSKLTIEELMDIEVSSTGFFEMPAEKAPGTIWIVDRDTIDNSPAMDLADLLDLHVPGIHMTSNLAYGALYASRGMVMPNNSTVLFMLDGQRLNTGVGTGINSGLRLPLIGDIDRLEVINGPCSIAHGSGAINGFVNLVPKNGTDNQGGFSDFTFGVRDHMYKGETGYGFTYGADRDLYLYAGAVRSGGIDVDTGDFPARTTVREFPETSYRSSLYWNHGGASLNLFIQKEVYRGELFDTYGIETPETYQQTAGIRPKFIMDLGETEALELSLPLELHDSAIQFGEGNYEEAGTEFHMEAEAVFKTTRFKNHQLALGGGIGRRHIDIGELSFENSPETPGFTAETDRTELSLFFEDIFHPMPGWTFSAGLRYDMADYDEAKFAYRVEDELLEEFISLGREHKVTPRLATSYEISPRSTVKFSYQEGFHYPSISHFLDLLEGPARLRTEKMQSYEGNYQLRLAPYHLEIGLNLYYNVFEDTLFATFSHEGNADEGDDPTGNKSFTNSNDRFASLGGELSIRWKPDDMTDFRFSYGYSRPLSFDDEEKESLFLTDEERSSWTGYPAHIVKSDITRHLLDKRLTLNLSLLYNSPVKTGREKELSYDRYNHHRFIVDAMARYRINDNLSIRLVGQNIFHNDVPAAGFYNAPAVKEFPSTEEPLFYIGLNWTY